MVAFVPNIPEQNAPQYIGYSKPLSKYDIGVDQTGASTVQGITQVGKDIVTGTDNSIKSIIDSAVHSSVDDERSQFTGALETMANTPQANRIGTDADSNPNYPSLTSGGQSVPPAIDAGINKAANVVSAGPGGFGKLNPSLYESRLDTIAKDLRGQYPGYRDYIDEKIAAMTGGTPANKYISELLQQINTNSGTQKQMFEKTLSEVWANSGQDGSQEIFQGLMNGTKNIADAQDWVARVKSLEVKAQRSSYQLSMLTNDQKTLELNANNNFNDIAKDVMSNSVVNLENSISGGDKTSFNFGDLQRTFSDIASGKVKQPSDQEAMAIGQALQAKRDQLATAMTKRMDDAGITKALGPAKVNEMVNGKLALTYDNWIDLLKNKDTGMAHYAEQAVKNVIANNTLDLLNTDDELGRIARASSAISKAVGPQAGAVAMQSSLGTGKLSSAVETFMKTRKAELVSQPDAANGGPIRTLQQALQEMHDSGVGVIKPGMDPKGAAARQIQQDRNAYLEMTNTPGAVLNSPLIPDSAKKNIIDGTYGIGNEDLLNHYEFDILKDDKKTFVPGKETVFNTLTAPANVDSIYELGRKDPANWQKFKTAGETWFAQLFGDKVRGLNEFAKRYDMSYDPDQHEFAISLKPSQGGAFGTFKPDPSDTFPLAGLNSALKRMAYIAKKDGQDPDKYISQVLVRQNNLDPNGEGLPNTLVKQIQDSKVIGKRSDTTIPESENFKADTGSEVTPLHDLVKTGESENNYDSLFGAKSSAKLTGMTVGEVMALQKHHTDVGSPSSAAGAYQFIRPTLAQLVKDGVVSSTDTFDEPTQDRMATALMEKRGLSDFKSGKITKEQFVNNLAKEFAAIPTTRGQSYYEGDGLNHSRVKLPKVFAALGNL